MNRHHWRLPDGVDELLPPAAWQLEQLRRVVLDRFDSWGYEYVVPPLIEYLDSLLVGSGHDLELQTFRMVDQRSGRMLGIRADMTSQAARIDASRLRSDGTQRLCYAGTVVHANPEGVLRSRVPLLAGAEIFGSRSTSADAEVVALMAEALECGGVRDPVLELGHVGIFRSLASAAELDPDDEEAVFGALQRKSQPDLDRLVRDLSLADGIADLVVALPELMGGSDVLSEARTRLHKAPGVVSRALDELEALAAMVENQCPGIPLRFDLCELAGYGYHTGPVFTAYRAGYGRAIARGGRYDAIGSAFGRARPATGFDVDLKRLPVLHVAPGREAVWAPAVAGVRDPERRAALRRAMETLRAEGTRVICALEPNEAVPAHCDRALVWQDAGPGGGADRTGNGSKGSWVLAPKEE
jgi:ATP phosphoribosyltransferase regulatory subunit